MAILNVPGLRGYQAQRMMQNQEQQAELGQIQGILGIQNMIEQRQMNNQLMPLKMQEMQAQIAERQRKAGIIDRYLGGAMGGGEVTGTEVTRDASGAPVSGGMSVPGMPVSRGGGGILSVATNPEAVTALKLAGIDLSSMYKTLTEPIKYEGGSMYRDRISGQERTIPRLGEGQTMSGGVVSAAPGYVGTVGDIARAQEEARAQFDIVQVPDGRGGTISMPRSVAAQRLGGAMPQQAAPMQGGMAPGMVPQSQFPMVSPQEQATRDAEAAAIRNREIAGGGIPTANVVAGSQSPVQVAQAPGQMGVTPSPVEQEVAKTRALSAEEKRGALPQAQLQIQTQVGDLTRLRTLANEIMRSPALERSVGLVGAVPSVPGSAAADTDALIAAMKAQVSGMKLQAMRNASKTGGAVGQVTEKEWPRLESMVVALDQKMSPEMFRQKVSELVLALDETERNITGAFQQEFGSVLGNQGQAPKVRRYNPETGKIE